MLLQLNIQFCIVLCCSFTAFCCLRANRDAAKINNVPLSPWKQWSVCSSTCGQGKQHRSRLLLTSLKETIEETRHCKEFSGCSKWSDWSHWTVCSKTCGTGQRYRERMCKGLDGNVRNTVLSVAVATEKINDISLSVKGTCEGQAKESQKCEMIECPTEAPPTVWGSWSEWNVCSLTCGTASGFQSRSRNCEKKEIIVNSDFCSGIHTQTQNCTPSALCPFKPEWQQWSQWTQCSETCGLGRMSRTRTRQCDPISAKLNCIQPEETSQTEHRECAPASCPVIDGNWGTWQEWSSCPGSCGKTIKTRIRHCNNPRPANGGKKCSGISIDHTSCIAGVCPVDGGWTQWYSCAKCVTDPVDKCKQGHEKFCRKCENPKPQYNGTACPIGTAAQWRQCWNVAACDNSIIPKPMNLRIIGFVNTTNVLVQWKRPPYGLAIQQFLLVHSVADDQQNYTEVIVDTLPKSEQNPLGEEYSYWIKGYNSGDVIALAISGKSQSNLGSSATDSFTVSRVDGQWGSWMAWSLCKETPNCRDSSTRSRLRKCDNPPPSPAGKPCVGSDSETANCFNSCPSLQT